MSVFNIITSKNSTNNKFVSRSENIYKRYKDEEEAYLLARREALKDEDAKVFDKKIKYVFKFVNFVTDNVSKLYDNQVTREIDEKNKDNKNLLELLKIVDKSFKNIDKEVDWTTFLTGTTLVKPFYNSEIDKFKFIVFPSHMCDYTSFPTDPTERKEIKVEYFNNRVKQTEIWDYNTVKIYVDGSLSKTYENNYNFLPFSKFINKETSFDYFDEPKSGLLNSQNLLTIKQINTDRTFKYQSASLLTLKSDTREFDELKIGPSSANHIGREDSIEFIKPDADLLDLLEFIKREFSLISKMYNIPDSIFDINTNASGVSIIRSKARINDYLKERKEKFINYEKELFIKAIKMLAIDKNITIPEDFDINIKYKEEKEPLTDDKIKELEFLLNNNLITRIDLLIEKNNITREEREEIYKKNKEINKDRLIDNNTEVITETTDK